MIRLAQFNHSETPPPSIWGEKGDQLKIKGEYETAETFERGELNIVPWYDGAWKYVLRPIDKRFAEWSAEQHEKACRNPNVGYSQTSERTSFYQTLDFEKDAGSIEIPCNGDCSSGWAAIAKVWGIDVDVNAWTGSMLNEAVNSRAYIILSDHRITRSSNYLLKGDVVLRPAGDTGGHTATVIDDGDEYQGYEIFAKAAYGSWNIRRAPSKLSNVVEVLNGDDDIVVLLQKNGWYLVEDVRSGKRGWISAAGIRAKIVTVMRDTWLRSEPNIINDVNKIKVIAAGTDLIYSGYYKIDGRGVKWFYATDGERRGYVSGRNSFEMGWINGI